MRKSAVSGSKMTRSYYHSKHEFLNFVRAKESVADAFKHTETISTEGPSSGSFSGTEARSFYESVISSTSKEEDDNTGKSGSAFERTGSSYCKGSNTKAWHSLKTKSKSQEISKSKKDYSIPDARIKNEFLRHAQEGNLYELRRLLRKEPLDINMTDQFNWTALMCAAQQGQEKVVRYLLKKGASWENIANTKGQTALDLARLSGHTQIVGLFKTQPSAKKHDEISTEPGIDKWCAVCQEGYTDSERKHHSSTVHLFNCKHSPQRSYYCIAGNNPGYKLMVKSGWDEETGLGPDGLGRKYPVKTVLKRDRLGLGNVRSAKKAKVTHFAANDETAVKRNAKETTTKREISSKKRTKKENLNKDRREKIWEQNMRIYMSTD